MNIEVIVVRNGKKETFQHTIPDTSKAALEAVVDYFDGQIGTTLAIYEKGTTNRLYKAMVDVWDLVCPPLSDTMLPEFWEIH